jgi:hypothetical protein
VINSPETGTPRVEALDLAGKLRKLLSEAAGPLTGIDPEKGIGFMAASLKNVSVLPITLVGIEPVDVSSDWRVREMRLGVLADEGEDALVHTRSFAPQHLNPGEIADVVIVWVALPCDSPRLADGRVSGPVKVRIVYSILGVRRAHTFHKTEEVTDH